MYKLIADSGSTKTDWVLLKGKQVVKTVNTIGFNPYFQSKDQISLEIVNSLKPYLLEYQHAITELHYYGAGCSTFDNCTMLENVLTINLNVPKIFVQHDLLAAARALCKKSEGIACILGTGSNSCLYNGKTILENVPSVGYLWGDHGSGAQIGKTLVAYYFDGKLSSDLKYEFESEGYDREEILNNVYKKNMPSKYLASLSRFISKHTAHPQIQEILESCFDSFFKMQINHYRNSKKHKVNIVGSIGYVYRDQLTKAAKQNGYEIGLVIKSPIEGLIDYHSS
jgi:N-acetylglucosamine kinase-like BadF-type ATPase